MRKWMRKALVSTLLVAVVGLALASKGGGGDKKSSNNIPLKTNFIPIRTSNGFTLKSGPSYAGSYMLGQQKTKNLVSFNTVITYQQGNSIYILPYRYKVSSSVYLNGGANTNQVLDLRIRMHK
jgi:hypothetical protein